MGGAAVAAGLLDNAGRLSSWDHPANTKMLLAGWGERKKETMNNQPTIELTDQQIENWRAVLCVTLGPFAILAPKEEIKKLAATMQNLVNQGQIKPGPETNKTNVNTQY